MMELFERLVVAIEKVAERMPKSAVVEINRAAEVKEFAELTAGVGTQPVSKYPADDDRDAWLEMCRVREIDVPPRTKTTTLIKQVKSWDAAHAGKPEPEAKKIAAKVEESDPFNVEEPAETRPVTREDVLGALQKIQKENGNGAVIAVLQKAGGVDKLKDLPEDKFAAVYKEATNG